MASIDDVGSPTRAVDRISHNCGPGLPRRAVAEVCTVETNRLVRTRMLGGVGGSRSNPGPIPMAWFVDFGNGMATVVTIRRFSTSVDSFSCVVTSLLAEVVQVMVCLRSSVAKRQSHPFARRSCASLCKSRSRKRISLPAPIG
jgi:hypothetical protein